MHNVYVVHTSHPCLDELLTHTHTHTHTRSHTHTHTRAQCAHTRTTCTRRQACTRAHMTCVHNTTSCHVRTQSHTPCTRRTPRDKWRAACAHARRVLCFAIMAKHNTRRACAHAVRTRTTTFCVLCLQSFWMQKTLAFQDKACLQLRRSTTYSESAQTAVCG